MLTDSKPVIELRNIYKHYDVGDGQLAVLRGVNISVARGELVAIVGPSGAGKSTLAHIMAGLTKPDSGEVYLHHKPLTDMGDRKLSKYRNRHIGFVFQNFGLLSSYTILENVLIPLMVRGGLSHKEQIARAQVYLQEVGLTTPYSQRADELSGGQRQRVAIARALVMEPEVLIADEPTGSLDSVKSHEIMDVLQTLVRSRSMTVVMVTHDPSLSARADRVIRILDGSITEEKGTARA